MVSPFYHHCSQYGVNMSLNNAQKLIQLCAEFTVFYCRSRHTQAFRTKNTESLGMYMATFALAVSIRAW